MTREAYIAAYTKCAPGVRATKGNICFSKEEVVCMVMAAGRLLGMEPIAEAELDSSTVEELFLEFDDFLQLNAIKSNAWIEDRELMNAISEQCPLLATGILHYRIVPSYRSRNTKGWTSNHQLQKVMRQYVFAQRGSSSEFAFSGAYNNRPDKVICKTGIFSCESPMYRHFQEYPQIPWSVILNTSYHGTHWVALFRESIDSPLEYFDSFALPVPLALRRVIKWLCKPERKTLKFTENKFRHQYDRFSCGPYSMYYIIQRSRKVPKAAMETSHIDKYVIERFRKGVFDNDPAMSRVETPKSERSQPPN
jgi:hypothetical protein